MEPLDRELTAEERDALIDRAARAVVRRRLEVPVTLALEMHRPLAFLSSQAMVVFTPMLAPAIGLDNMQRLTALLQQPGNIDRLLDRIEELATERETGKDDAPPAANSPE